MNVTTTRLAAALLTLMAAIVSAPSGAAYPTTYSESAHDAGDVDGDYRVSARLRAEWLELVREIPLGSAISLGLGLHLGGPELELRKLTSADNLAGRQADLHRWLSLDARLKFHDFQPYARLSYRSGGVDRGFGLRVDAGLRLLKIEDLSVKLIGPMAAQIADHGRLLDEFEHDARDDLDDYYVEPLIRVEMSYRFG